MIPLNLEDIKMSFADWPEEEVAKVQEGLLLLGWRADDRLTSDDAHLIADVAYKALDLKKAGPLAPDAMDQNSLERRLNFFGFR